ncbi:NAD(P)H-dependent oxidoreductase [Compostibacter hankyongensis]|uniref:NADPH-dependent FMN reductase n=1 Tax=Compostibacter hankyongensis TaxID=1007089 RepID=A0ABP8FG49_9BACT
MKIAIILGSIRIGRRSHHVAAYLQQRLSQFRGVEAEVIDPAEHALPLMDERYGMHPSPSELLLFLGEKIKAADAYILLSPEYNGSYSGVLKNVVDYFGRQMSGKPIGVTTVSGGRLGGINASHHLQSLVLSIQAYPQPQKLLVSQVQDLFDEAGQVIQESFVAQVDSYLKAFLPFAHALVGSRRDPWLPETIDDSAAVNA